MSRPVGISTSIGYSRYGVVLSLELICLIVGILCHFGKELLPHSAEIGKVIGLSEVFLSYLKLWHLCRLAKCPKQGIERFARLEVDRSVLHLNNHVVKEFAIEMLKLQSCLLGAVRIGRIIDKCPPHHYASIRT